ncbi:hypothetical protein BG006_011449 [Podila minutissima]|uniref:F-box domain-containing protein n=1 Tax=Podila minutissima TaxID=64525 RepID=A0A9P5SBX5_9FUNG|nr:hypothetical protein BG006_011449 [Podila minutissima]
MTIGTILAVPQISRNISIHLRQHDLTQCVRVSQAWHNTLTPHLWSLVKGFNIRHFQSSEARAALLKNGHFIRVLKTSSHEFLTYLGPSCENLTMFDFSGSFPLEGHEDGYVISTDGPSPEQPQQHQNDSGENNSDQQQHMTQQQQKLGVMASFLLQNKNLTTLSFRRRVDSSRYIDRLLTDYQILERLPNLKDLTLSSKTLHSSALVIILRYGQKLERLVLKIRQVDWQIRFSNQEMAAILRETAAQPWKLRDLLLGPALGLDIAMVVKAAGASLQWLRLERLSLHEARELSQVVRDHCPNLEHLLIMTDNQIDKNGLMLLLDATAPTQPRQQNKALIKQHDPSPLNKPDPLALESPRTSGLTNFQGHALVLPDFLIHRLFGNHYATLEILDLSRCQGIRSETLQQILCRCPNLRVVDMASEHLTLETKDIVYGQPWVCHKLKILRVEIASSPPPYGDIAPLLLTYNGEHDTEHATQENTEMELQRRVLAQIGTLSRMEELRIGGPNGRSMDLTLGGGGLEQLSGLKLMRTLNVRNMGHKVGQQELEWMVEHWPMVRCFMFDDYNVDMIDMERVRALQRAKRQGVYIV